MRSTVVENYIHIRLRESVCIYIFTVNLLSFFLSSLTRPFFISSTGSRPNKCIYICPTEVVIEIYSRRINLFRLLGILRLFT